MTIIILKQSIWTNRFPTNWIFKIALAFLKKYNILIRYLCQNASNIKFRWVINETLFRLSKLWKLRLPKRCIFRISHMWPYVSVIMNPWWNLLEVLSKPYLKTTGSDFFLATYETKPSLIFNRCLYYVSTHCPVWSQQPKELGFPFHEPISQLKGLYLITLLHIPYRM